MKIVIHGTYGGYKTITPEKAAGLFDVRPDPCKEKAVGQEAYSIHFNDGDVIFSKYRIIRDGIGDLRTGNVAYSVIIPDGEKLAGLSVKELLDELEKSFFSKNNIKDDYILGNVSNNWTFVADIKNIYEPQLEDKPKLYCQQGERDAAFIYYSSDIDLKKYLDAPARQGYYEYKQIFFVQEELKDKPENPLNALGHTEKDLTSEISPEPPIPVIIPEAVPIEPADENAALESVSDNPADEKKIQPDNDTENTDNEPQPETIPDEKARKSIVFSSRDTKPPLGLRLPRRLLVIILGVTVIVLASLIIIRDYKARIEETKRGEETKRENIRNMITTIRNYVESGELFMNTLESYSDSLKNINTKILKTDTVDYNYVLPRIDSAVNIRKIINTADIAQWKESDLQCCGNPSLTKLKTAIDSIKKENYRDTIEMRLREKVVSDLGLDSITSLIDSVNNALIKEDEKKEKEKKEMEEKKKKAKSDSKSVGSKKGEETPKPDSTQQSK